MKVLIVEDERCLRNVMRRILTGHDVTSAGDGQEGLELLLGQDFDLVISDVRMPKMNGVQMYQAAVRAKPELKGRFMFASASLDEVERAGIEEETVAKPYSPSEFLEKVNGG